MSIPDLIARLEAATGQDRDLDARIAYLVKPALERMGTLEKWLASDASRNVLTYTWSIDDAFTLVPEGWSYILGSGASAAVPALHGLPHAGPWCRLQHRTHHEINAEGPTAAIAICIASLQARAR